MKTQLND